MTNDSSIPAIVVNRIPVYLRLAEQLHNEGITLVTSHKLGELLGTSSAQIRKDFSSFGEQGKQGSGYNTSTLIRFFRQILGITDNPVNVLMIGDNAIVNYQDTLNRGFRIYAAESMLYASSEILADMRITIAILAVKPHIAQFVATMLVENGITSILSYVPGVTLDLPTNVSVKYSDTVIMLSQLKGI